MSIQVVTLQEADAIAQLNQKLIADEGSDNPMNLAQLTKRMQGWLAQEYGALGIKRQQAWVAYCLYRLEANHLYIRQLYTDPAYRGQGLARALIEHVQHKIAPNQAIHLEVLATNHQALGFYQKMGFLAYSHALRRPPRGNG